MSNYFDVVNEARTRVESEKLKVLVLGSTYKETPKPYYTYELADFLRSLGHEVKLVEENKEGDEVYPANLPYKMIEMAKGCDVIMMLVTNMGGTPAELPYICLMFSEKSFFFIRRGDELGGVIEGHLAHSHIAKYHYELKGELMVHAERCLNIFKLGRRMRGVIEEHLKKKG